MTNQHGGARPGSGRKAKAERYAGPIERAEDRIAESLPEIVEALIVEARAGNAKAAMYLADRILGRVAQALEHTGPEGGPMKVVIEYADGPPDLTEAPSRPGQDPPGDAAV